MADMTLEEALAAADVSTTPVNDILMVDAEARTIIVPASEMLFGVRQDMDAERKHFKCPKIVGDNVDLSNCHIYISYVPSKQDGTYDINEDVGAYLCEDLDVDGDYVTFSWKLSGNVFVKAGYIAFAVYAKQADADGNLKTKWHTTFAIGKVLDTLPDGEQIVEKYADVIEQLLNKMENVEKVATPEAMKGYVEEFLNENPPSGMTDEEREQLQKNTEDISSLSDEMEQLKQTGAGLSTEAIDKLEEVGNYLVYTTANGGSKWTELIAILRNGSSGGGSSETVPATGITLDKTTLSFTDSTSQTLTATVEPSNSTDSVTWETSDAGVATVSSGVVSPVSNGSCTITAKAGSYSASCEVTVSVETEIVTYTITNNLTNVSTDNPVTTITENSPYEANLTPDTDYEFDSVTVTMGGVDITSDVYADGAIVISAATGNIVITASAVELESGELVFLDYVELSGGAYFDTGITSNLKNKYLIGVMSPEITDRQFIWGARARNNSNLDTSDYYDDTFALDSSSSADRYTKGNSHGFYMYDSQSMQGINGSDNKSYLVPWYLYTKWDASCLEAYSNEEMISPLGASTFIKGSLTSNHFPYALNMNTNGAEITLDPEKHAPSNVYLGKVNTTLGSDSMSKYPVPVDGMKYYVYKVWSESDVLLMHLRPAKMGAKVGMYDVVSSTFFESPDGTVTAGSEVA